MRVKLKHIGRACRCTQCREPVFVTHEDVVPPIKLFERDGARYFNSEDVPLHWQAGDRFVGSYEVLDFLGAGGMGVVHRVHHKLWGVELAVKTPNAKLVKRPDMLRQFEKEAEVWVGLPLHPNIVYCYFVTQLGSVPRIFMEYVPGTPLSECIRARKLYDGDAPLRKLMEIAIQVAGALHIAHAKGLVHQDVKPGNILITPQWGAKVTDFGLVRALSAPSGVDDDTPTFISGTPPYSSPEQVANRPVTVKADMWGWAASVTEMIVGRIAWRDYHELLDALESYLSGAGGLSPLPKVPEVLAQLLRDCFREDPADRPADMNAVSDRMQAIYADCFGDAYSVPLFTEGEDTLASLNNRAVSLAALGKKALAETLWNDMLLKDPSHFESRYNFALHLWRCGRISDLGVLNLLRDECEAHPDAWQPKHLFGSLMIERGDYATARETLDMIPEPDFSRRDVFITAAIARSDAKRGHVCLATVNAHDAPLAGVRLSNDGKHGVSFDTNGVIKYWQIEDGVTCEKSFNVDSAVTVGFLRNGRWLVIGKSDGEVEIRDLYHDRVVATFAAHEGAVLAVASNPGETRLATGGYDSLIRVWDLRRFTEDGVYEGHIRPVNDLDWSPSGRFLLSGSTDACVRLWDCGMGESLRKLRGHRHRVYGVAFGADEKTAYSCGRDGLFNVWNLQDGSLRRSYEAHHSEAYSVSASGESEYVLTGSRSGAIKLWDMQKGYCVRSFVGSAPCQMSRNGRVAMSAGPEGTLCFWGISTLRARYPATPLFFKE